MYYILAVISAIIFAFVPQNGAIETALIFISIIILAVFSINIEARVKILKSENISDDSIYKKNNTPQL